MRMTGQISIPGHISTWQLSSRVCSHTSGVMHTFIVQCGQHGSTLHMIMWCHMRLENTLVISQLKICIQMPFGWTDSAVGLADDKLQH